MLGIDAADNEATTVDVQHRRDGSGPLSRRVNPNDDLGRTLWPRYRTIVDIKTRDVHISVEDLKVATQPNAGGLRIGWPRSRRDGCDLGQLRVESVLGTARLIRHPAT